MNYIEERESKKFVSAFAKLQDSGIIDKRSYCSNIIKQKATRQHARWCSKKTGVARGFSDYIILWPSPNVGHPPLTGFLEFKAYVGQKLPAELSQEQRVKFLTNAQILFRKDMIELGFLHGIAFTCLDAIDVITQWGVLGK